MINKKGLGRGLAALIPDAEMTYLSDGAGKTEPVEGSSRLVPTAALKPNPFQPRSRFDEKEMGELVDSIREHGVLQPILVRPVTDANHPYEIVAGERRWRAAQAAGLEQVPVIVHAVDDRQSLELAIIENVQRHDISAIEAALAYRRLANEFGLSQEDVAKRVGKSRSAVANTMRLLDLPVEIRTAIEGGELSEGHGRAILLANGEGSRRALFKSILRDKLSVRQVERMAQSANALAPAKTPKERGDGALLAERRDLQLRLEKRYGTRVEISGRGAGGRVAFKFTSAEEFERLRELLETQRFT